MERRFTSEANLVIDLNAKPMHFNETLMYNGDVHEVMEDEFNKMKWENKKLNELLTIMCRNYHDLKKTESQDQSEVSRKRKNFEIENYTHCCCNSCDEYSSGCRPKEMRSNVSRVHFRIDPSDTTLVVKDGYQWRKYGQKVTRDNPSPRAYYKCSMAPSCSVKKKVQRSVDDPSVLVATYEGQHNHHPSGGEAQLPGVGDGANLSPVGCSAAHTICNTSAIQQLIVEQMANTLTRNHSFTEALVAAITGRILDDVSEETLSNS